jgi:hypothetical protein
MNETHETVERLVEEARAWGAQKLWDAADGG